MSDVGCLMSDILGLLIVKKKRFPGKK